MDLRNAIGGALVQYACFIPLLTFHEFAHAWTAWKCGDDTAHSRGRVSLNPIVHMELLGTVILPLVGMISGAMGAGVVIIGWGKPVPVNPRNLKHPRIQDCLIAMAGPTMNLLLAFLLLALAKAGQMYEQKWLVEICAPTAQISLVLCFFNLLPIPPLDGSHLIFNLVRMSYETYIRLAMFGFVAVVALLQLRFVRDLLTNIVRATMIFFGHALNLEGIDNL